ERVAWRGRASFAARLLAAAFLAYLAYRLGASVATLAMTFVRQYPTNGRNIGDAIAGAVAAAAMIAAALQSATLLVVRRPARAAWRAIERRFLRDEAWAMFACVTLEMAE